MDTKNLGFETKMIHAGYAPDVARTTAEPIYMSNAYYFDSADHAASLFMLKENGNIYTRLQNPTTTIFEERMAQLEGGSAAVACATGHSAIFMTLASLASEGDEIVASIQIYGGAISLLGTTMKKLGIVTKFVDSRDPANFAEAITDKTKAVFTELMGNPNSDMCDIEAVAAIAHEHGVPLIVDSTFASPYLCRPIEFGADIVIHSATKFICGHGTAMAGVVIDSGKFPYFENKKFPQFNEPDPSYGGIIYSEAFRGAELAVYLRTKMLRDFGSSLSPFNSFMMIQGLETLSLRMERHCSNAKKIAEFLEASKYVEKVNYPGLPSSPFYGLAKKYLPLGAGSVFTFVIKGGRRAGEKFLNSLKIFANVANLGDIKSLVSHPASTTHSQLSDEQLENAGIYGGTIRLSVGLETAEDLMSDLSAALEASAKA